MTLPPSPVFLLNQGWQGRDLLVPVGSARVASGATAPGLLLDWGHLHDEGVRAAAASPGPLSPILANPGTTEFDRSTIGRHKAAAPWIQRSQPLTDNDWDQACDDAIQAQQALGLDGILLPTRNLGTADWPDGVQDVLDAARRAHARNPGAELLVGLILAEQWIVDPRLRRTLLNQLTDLPPKVGVSLHVHWSSSDAANDAATLSALRTVVQAISGDDRRVLLVEAGGLGWLSLAWGAWGFSAGLSGASWRRSTQIVRRASGQPAVRVPRLFEPDLLHHVRQTTHQRLTHESGYSACACTFCGQLKPATTTTWDHSLAAQHGLTQLAALTERVAAPRLANRHARVKGLVEAAQEFEAGVSFRLTGDARPLHLAAWRAEL